MARKVNVNPSFIEWSQSNDSSELYIGIPRNKNEPAEGDIPLKKLRIYAGDKEKGLLDINIEQIEQISQQIDEPVVMQFREISFCRNGQTVYMQILGSEPYTK